MTKIPSILFDKKDYQLLQIVDDVLERGPQSRAFRSLFLKYMHPQGIKEMAASRGLRIAYAVVSLLGSFEKGQAKDRLAALRSLRDEVMLSSSAFYQKNTARVLLQIMKELVRTRNDEIHRLKLAHDFRMVFTGTPKKIRKELAKYHLAEMPEAWNQFAFDDHVHDANTKGRKSPTHLIMDAWIKGIRHLTVVYYNFVSTEVVEELLEAGSILDVQIQVGIEITTRFRSKYIRFTWEPTGFIDNQSFLKFLGGDKVAEFFEEGREVSNYQQKYVFDVLTIFNDKHLKTFTSEFGIDLRPLDKTEFLNFVGTGQPSVLHLARFIQNHLIEHVEARCNQQPVDTNEIDAVHLHRKLREIIKKFTIETIIVDYLIPARNPEVHDPSVPQEHKELPKLLMCEMKEIITRLLTLHSSSEFTLNLGNLSAQDTLELLYAGEGMITHIETYNLKNVHNGITAGVAVVGNNIDDEANLLNQSATGYGHISRLQEALNDDNVISLKRAVKEIILDFEKWQHRLEKRREAICSNEVNNGEPIYQYDIKSMQERKLDLLAILWDLKTFHNNYRKRPLGSRIGSGSTGQAEHQYGMGFVVLETIPASPRRAFHSEKDRERDSLIPVTALMTKCSYHRKYPLLMHAVESLGGSYGRSLFEDPAARKWVGWNADSFIVHIGKPGNIGTLGGLKTKTGKDTFDEKKGSEETAHEPFKYLNTHVKNVAKVIIGFIPAFLTFFLTKDWWVLSYFGAVIWFGITGSRNIIQSVLGGGGLRRSPLLPWNSLISWSRISDSLLYTGFSVPLLDYIVKTLLLDRTFGVTTGTNPIVLYSVMGLANGIYISSHNAIRGLPQGATIGNFFRSILAIPVAIVLNSTIALCLGLVGIPDSAAILQKWAAIISKFASDCVAAIIEGVADRQNNIRARTNAYMIKISQLFSVFSRLEILFPEEDVLAMLEVPKTVIKNLGKEARDLENLIIVNALDLMYFWMYQPRSRKALAHILRNFSEEEWLIFYRSQLVLKRHKKISRVFLDGLVGKNFTKALSFYLDQSSQYLSDMEKLGERLLGFSCSGGGNFGN
ncbi:MAG: hypothetical protein LJE64_06575 [Desulfofustis sp.]|nr:hypothetical protein [Desulfofustis sp.]